MDLWQFDPASPMLFTQFNFWVFFCIVMVGLSAFYKHLRRRNLFLFLFSLFFYYKAGGGFVFLLLFVTILNFFLGRITGSSEKKTNRKMMLIFSLILNVGMLAYFKYSYFFIDTLNAIFHTQWHVFNVFDLVADIFTGKSLTLTAIILPIGISFYTFQNISYSVEVYRKRIEPVKSFIDFAFYLTFFPQLISGPIVKSTLFVPQIMKPYSLDRREYGQAILLIIGGLIKKMVVADYISLNFVTRVFENPGLFTGFENLMAVYGYTLQIYCDFSGYTDIAIGIALLMGFRLPVNFNSPYKAVNINEFWQRWHISLTSWFRDYMFLPIAYFLSDRMKDNKYYGVKTELWIYMICTMIVFMVCGLWHGASANFILWGGIHGLALVSLKFFTYKRKSKRGKKSFVRFISIFFTFHFIALTWIIFRGTGSENMYVMIRRIFFNFHPELIFQVLNVYPMVFILIFSGFLLHWLPAKWKAIPSEAFINFPEPVKILVVVTVVVFLYQFKSSGIVPFIYFDF